VDTVPNHAVMYRRADHARRHATLLIFFITLRPLTSNIARLAAVTSVTTLVLIVQAVSLLQRGPTDRHIVALAMSWRGCLVMRFRYLLCEITLVKLPSMEDRGQSDSHDL